MNKKHEQIKQLMNRSFIRSYFQNDLNKEKSTTCIANSNTYKTKNKKQIN